MFLFFLLLICTRKLCLAKWPQLRINVIRRRFKTIIDSGIPHFIFLRVRVSCAPCMSCAKRQQEGETMSCYVSWRKKKKKQKRKSMMLLCASPGPRRSLWTRSVYCAQKKAITMLMCRSGGVTLRAGRERLMERAESPWVNSKMASGERFISNTARGEIKK